MRKVIISIAIFSLLIPVGLVLFLPSHSAQAQATNVDDGIVPCGRGDGTVNNEDCNECHLIGLIQNITFFLYWKLVPVVATILFVVAGFLIMLGGENPVSTVTGTAGSSGSISQGKAVFKTTIIGVVLIYISFPVTNFVLHAVAGDNDDVSSWYQRVNCTPVSFPEGPISTPIPLPTGGGGGGGATPETQEPVSSDEYTDAEARAALKGAGITIPEKTFPPCSATRTTRCSNFHGVKKNVINEAIRLKRACDATRAPQRCRIQANDATGPGHSGHTGGHNDGFKIDFQAYPELNEYIRAGEENGFIPDPAGDPNVYLGPGGTRYMFEPGSGGGHWDVFVP